MDCLSLLREFVRKNEKVTYVDGNNKPVERIQEAEEFIFGEITRFHKDEMTVYPNKQAKGFYSLAAVLLLLEHQQKDYSTYLKNSVAANIISVSFLDKKPLLDYLEGVTETLPQVKLETNQQQDNPGPDIDGSSGNIHSGSPAKRKREIDPLILRLYDIEFPKKPRYNTLKHKHVRFTPGLQQMIINKLINPPPVQHESFIKKNGPPLIIVPLNVSANITKYNVKKFLQGEGFELSTDLLDAHVVKEEHLVFRRMPILDHSSKQPRYVVPDDLPNEVEVIDSVDNLKKSDWDRVVAVFTIGKDWQFRGFKWENPEELFNNVPGVYVMNRADPYFDPKLAQGWKVRKFDISNKSPESYSRFLEVFWQDVDAHIRLKKPWYINDTPYWF